MSVPLYKQYKISSMEENAKALADIVLFDGAIDAYCVDCGQLSVFQSQTQIPPSSDKTRYFKEQAFKPLESNQTHTVTFLCSRDKDHKLHVHFKFIKNTLIKVGQHPSLADIASEGIKQYRKLLNQNNFSDLQRAIGLNAHGIGAGALIYLRRVFENIIEETHLEAKLSSSWDEEKYIRSRIDEKIKLLKDYLPSLLFEMKDLYAILSRGIHSLNEKECLSYFNPLRIGIEIILDQKLEQEREKKKQRKIEEAKREIARIKNTLDH